MEMEMESHRTLDSMMALSLRSAATPSSLAVSIPAASAAARRSAASTRAADSCAMLSMIPAYAFLIASTCAKTHRPDQLNFSWFYDLNGFFFACAVVKSYQYTSLTSVMLLDCWSIPCVIVLTWVFLKTKYGLRKFFGVGVCVAGLILVVFSDVHAPDRAKGPNPLKGDLLVIFGSMFYACSNVTEVLPFLGYAVVMFLFYSTVPTVLKICGATMLNLSLLTSDMWAVLIRIFAYHEKVDWIYFVAFACTAAGIIIYSYKYVSTVGYGGILACLKTWFSISTDTETEASGILVARRGSKEAENTAQVAGASDEQGKQGDEEAGAENPA
nr:unnamed protein product [Digitaria exilis]